MLIDVVTPPAIPACRMSEPPQPYEHLLLWTHAGLSHVRSTCGQEHRVGAGTGIWLPAGAEYEIRTEPGAVVFPTWVPVHAIPGAPKDIGRFVVEDVWRDWLIAHFAHAYTTYDQVSPAELGKVLSASGPSHPRIHGDSPEAGEYPPIPESVVAGRIARELLRNPALDHSVEQWAVWAASSANTVRRGFLRDTGLTFAQWRSSCRLAAASEFLAAGYDVGQVAARAGFASRSGFTRAFRERYGLTPRDYAAACVARPSAGLTRRVQADRDTAALSHLLDDEPSPPHTVPAGQNRSRIAPYNVLTWMYRGRGWARVGDHTFQRAKGDTLWLPAGIERETGLPENSLSLPIGVLSENDAPISEPLRAQFPSTWEAYLLYCAVTANTPLRPENYEPRHILDVFDSQLAVARSRAVPMPTNVRAREAATDFLRRISTSAEGTASGLPDGIDDAFRAETGMTFARWRHAARMRIARQLLASEVKPSAVAGRVGYTQVSNFSRAFTRFHHMTPRDYQEQESETL